MKNEENRTPINKLRIDEFDMNYALVVSGKIKNLLALQDEILELAEKKGCKVQFQDIDRGRLLVKKDESY